MSRLASIAAPPTIGFEPVAVFVLLGAIVFELFAAIVVFVRLVAVFVVVFVAGAPQPERTVAAAKVAVSDNVNFMCVSQKNMNAIRQQVLSKC